MRITFQCREGVRRAPGKVVHGSYCHRAVFPMEAGSAMIGLHNARRRVPPLYSYFGKPCLKKIALGHMHSLQQVDATNRCSNSRSHRLIPIPVRSERYVSKNEWHAYGCREWWTDGQPCVLSANDGWFARFCVLLLFIFCSPRSLPGSTHKHPSRKSTESAISLHLPLGN